MTAERRAQQIEQWPVERLKPYDRNAKIHSPAQVKQIADSIKRFGFNNPVLVDSQSGIIAGHGRYAAARQIGLATVPVIVLDHLSDAERRAYIIADNRIAENAAWDNALLTEELASVGDLLEMTGFSTDEFEAMIRKQQPPDEFAEYGEDIETNHQCPKCGYQWSGPAES